MTGRDEYLYLKKEVMEQFTECWETFESHEEMWEKNDTTKSRESETATPKSASKSKPKPKAKGEKVDGTKESKDTSPFDAALKEAIALRKDLLFVQGQCHTIASLANASEEWAWAGPMLGGLTTAKKVVDDAITGFGMKLMCEEVRDLKKCYTDTDFISEVSKLSGALGNKVQAAVKEIRMLMRMHRSRQDK